MEIMTRMQAAKLGLHIYFTGKPCINGHTSGRYTLSGSCIDCVKAHVKNNRKARADKIRQVLNAARGA